LAARHFVIGFLPYVVPVIRSAQAQQQVSRVQWGLIPFFAKVEPPVYATRDDRIETLDAAASCRGLGSEASDDCRSRPAFSRGT